MILVLFIAAAYVAGTLTFLFLRREGCPLVVAFLVAIVYGLLWPVALVYIILAFACGGIQTREST